MKIFIGVDKTLYPDLTISKYLVFCRKRAYIKLIDCLIALNIYSSLTFNFQLAVV